MAHWGPTWASVWFPGLCSERATRQPCSSSVSKRRDPGSLACRPCGGSCLRSRSPRSRCSAVAVNRRRRTAAPTKGSATPAPARSSAAPFEASVLAFFSLPRANRFDFTIRGGHVWNSYRERNKFRFIKKRKNLSVKWKRNRNGCSSKMEKIRFWVRIANNPRRRTLLTSSIGGE